MIRESSSHLPAACAGRRWRHWRANSAPSGPDSVRAAVLAAQALPEVRAVPEAQARRAVVAVVALTALAAVALAGCASPSARFSNRIAQAGLAPEIIAGCTYQHLVVRKPGRNGPLHVYIEGDGTPWQTVDVPADDPTPRIPLALTLMLADPQESIYLGRPCYFGVADPQCHVAVWTDERYSTAVVQSMSRALDRALAAGPGARLWLLGHSGGGVLAVLLARERSDVARVVTVGANVDVAGWAALHGYTSLAGSLDPRRLPLRPGAPEIHLIGSEDRIVPPALVNAYAADRPGTRVVEWPGFDHVCCWADQWARILATLTQE